MFPTFIKQKKVEGGRSPNRNGTSCRKMLLFGITTRSPTPPTPHRPKPTPQPSPLPNYQTLMCKVKVFQNSSRLHPFCSLGAQLSHFKTILRNRPFCTFPLSVNVNANQFITEILSKTKEKLRKNRGIQLCNEQVWPIKNSCLNVHSGFGETEWILITFLQHRVFSPLFLPSLCSVHQCSFITSS